MKVVAFLVSVVIGFVIGHYLLEGAAAAYASILISYHLYLGYLILAAEGKVGFSMAVGPTIVTHSAILALLIGLPYMRERVPLFGLISLLMPGLAPFEAKWLFGGDRKEETAPAATAATAKLETATAEDHEAFRQHLKQEYRPFRKPGRSIDEEFSFWLADRAKSGTKPAH